MSFSELGLSPKVLAAVEATGYTTPTPIQAQAIPHVLQRKDVLGIAQTGTGKTAAFTLPMLTLLEKGRARARMPRTLILEPTRELAAQVEENFVKYGAGQGLSVALLIGGVSFGDQDMKITRGVDVLIATPGRLLDHVERGKLLLTGVELLVIDEADRMLDMGFIPDIERICKLVPFTRQTLFFTATMPPEIQRITEQFLHNPERVEVSRPATAAATITQALVASGKAPHAKREVLRGLIRGAENLKNGIIFCNRKTEVALLHRSLQRHGFNAVALHGDMDQRSRMEALDRFRNGDATLLVASDVAARGLDIPDVSHVFNFDVPFHADDYVHRIGRTGRAGRSGWAFTLASTADTKQVSAIEALIGSPIAWTGDPASDALNEDGDEPSRERRPRRARPGSERREGGEGARQESRDGSREGGRRRGRERSSEDRPSAERQAGERQTGERQAGERSSSRRSSSAEAPGLEAGDSPRREAGGRGGERRDRAPGPVHSSVTGRSSAPARPRREDRDDGPPVVGLGDHVPSFLLQPVRRTSA